ncbi:MAG: hypothetical protein IJG63_03820 [Oscillospiraceae bacterium]|nr:hypothetical protein [Oscillospiraceae bacterium]
MMIMEWMAFQGPNIPLILSGAFYALLCVFSIVTGLIYMSGKKELNPLELSDRLMAKLENGERRRRFARRMGLVTFAVGLVQGLTAWAILKGASTVLYRLALGFTLFSIASVLLKLKGKLNAFPLLKLAAYLAVLLVLLLPSARALFF